jgi:hypothetical protein
LTGTHKGVKKGRAWLSWIITLSIWGVIALIICSGLTLRNPPGSDLVFEFNNKRAYVVHDVDGQKAMDISRWAVRYSGVVLDSKAQDLGRSARSELFSGDVALVQTAMGPKETRIWNDFPITVGSRDMLVLVEEQPLTPNQVLARARVALFARS